MCPRCKRQPFGPIAEPVRLCPEESDELGDEINDLLNLQSRLHHRDDSDGDPFELLESLIDLDA